MSHDDVTRRVGKARSRGAAPDRAFHSGGATHPIPASVDELPFGGTLGRYLVLSVLGKGGMGVVYAAYDPTLDRRIAVKVLRGVVDEDATDGRTRMQREAQALARLSHPNVITVHDVGEHAGAMYLAMELVRGSTLTEWQRHRGWRAIVEAYADAARGLAAAHAVGLIHRDFKPENVLVGDDGRVRVTDFGLARLVAPGAEPAPVLDATAHEQASPSSQLASSITAAGAVMGTPRYMAPEQIGGGAVDARTDQFSWCVALWEALYREQPFPTANLALRAAAIEVEPPRPPASSKVPRAVGRILARGLAVDPASRWPDLDALCAALRRALAPRRAWIAGALVASRAAVAVVAVVARGIGDPTSAAGERAASPIDAVWPAEARRAISASFTATGAPFAADALGSLERALGSWRVRWRTSAIESCRATRVTGTQSEAVLDLRTACLGRRRDELASLLAALTRADRKLVEHARTLELPDLDACNDPAGLAGTTPPPQDPDRARARESLEAELAKIEGELIDGLSIERARALAAPTAALLARAAEVGWRPLIARANQVRAGIERELGQGRPARTTLLAGAAAASASGDLDRLVEIYADLADVEARLTSEYALGESWVALAEGTLARLGPRTDKQLRLHRQRAVVAQRAGRLEDARAANEAALVLARTRGPNAELEVLGDLGLVMAELGDLDTAVTQLEAAQRIARAELGASHPKLAAIEHDLATVSYRRGKYAEAEQGFRSALAVRERALGTDDIAVAITTEALGIALAEQGRIEEAQPHLERALSIFEARLGPDHPDVANALNDIGGAYHRAGEFQRELEVGQRALAIRERALGPDHPEVAQSLVNTAIASKALGKWDVVLPNYRRALAIFEATRGSQHIETALTRLNYAEALRGSGKLDEAARAYEAAREPLVKQLGADHPVLAHIWNGVGQLALARGETAAAVEHLERAVAMRTKDSGDPSELAESRFALARALGRSSPRAASLAAQARDAYRAAGAGYARQLAEIEAWLGRVP
ncbi:MAG: tetratricopeptide repeat protein [Kofleriaceae bacterium]